MTKDREAMELARELLRGSLLEDAAARLISQILKEAHDSRIKPLQERVEELEVELREAHLQALAALGQASDAYDAARRLQDTIRKALHLMEMPDYGDANAKTAHFLKAYNVLVEALEEETEE